jgi:hypothetical protein
MQSRQQHTLGGAEQTTNFLGGAKQTTKSCRADNSILCILWAVQSRADINILSRSTLAVFTLPVFFSFITLPSSIIPSFRTLNKAVSRQQF